MNGRIGLDTNVASRYLENDPAVTRLLSNPSVIYLPVPVIAELLYGAEKSARRGNNLKYCNELIFLCESLDITRRTAVIYSKTKLALKRAGRPIPENDIWIASVCIEHDMPLVTSDVHFSYVDGLVTIKV